MCCHLDHVDHVIAELELCFDLDAMVKAQVIRADDQFQSHGCRPVLCALSSFFGDPLNA